MCQSGSWQETEANLQCDSEENLTHGLFTEVWITKKMASTQGLAISGSHFWPLAWKGQGSKSHQSLVRARGRGEEPPDRGYTQRTQTHCQTAWWSRGSEVGSRHALTSLPACVPGALQEARGQRSLSAAVHSGQLPEAQSRTTRQRIMGEGKR